ncbi:MAG TPA: glycosyltransferase family 39 protein [Anaerolineales bacterium]|nr:glycosyltransferase family 39 protein [Anaerolineales bacterium]
MKKSQSAEDLTVRKARGAFALLTVSLVAIGQVILYTTPINDKIIVPASLWICLAGVLLFIASLAIKPPRFIKSLFERLSLTGASPWVAGAIILSILAALSMVLFRKSERTNYIPVLSFWAGSMICYLAAFSQGFKIDPAWKKWLKENRNELLIVGGLTLLALILRFYKLGTIPRIINGDEGQMGMAAQATTYGRLANPFALWANFGALYLQGIYFFLNMFGSTPFALRLLAAIGGTLAIPAIYLLARQIGGKRIALISTSLLAFSHTHLNFSRTAAVGYIQDTWLIPLEFFLLLTGIQKRSSWRTALAAILLAIHFSIYLTAQSVVVLVLIFMVIAFLFFRPWIKPALKQVGAFWGGLAILLIPEATYVVQHPDEFFARMNSDGTFQSGWLAQTVASTGQNAFQILGQRVIHAFLSLIYYPAIDFYGSPVPTLTLVAATLFLVGLGIAIWRIRKPEYLLVNCYFWGFTFAIGIFSVPASADSYRMLIVLPAAMILAAVALDQVLELIGMSWEKAHMAYGLAVGVVLVSLMVTNLWNYYVDFAGRCLYSNNPQDRFASYLGSFVRTVHPEDTVYLLSDDIFFYGSHASVDFLSGNRSIINVKDPVDTLTAGAEETIIANPNRFDELKAWAAAHPGGDIVYHYDCTKVIMITYQFP